MIIGKITGLNLTDGIGAGGKKWIRYEFVINGNRYSTFSASIGEKFKVGDHVQIEGEQGEKYFDMRAMHYYDGSKTPEIPVQKMMEAPKQKQQQGTSFYVSYAKDIFCAILGTGLTSDDMSQDMKIAIDLVKQARGAFE